MILRPHSESELEQQRAAIETAFRQGWQPVGAGEPRILTDRAYAEARKILDGQAGWTGLDQTTIEAVRAGAHPGDQLPPLLPHSFIDKVTDVEVILTGSGSERRVAVLFFHEHFPGVRFGHRFRFDSYGEGHERIWLKEEIESGALHRMMDTYPSADNSGVVWTTWGSPAH